MKFASLGSGSSGNATLISFGSTLLLLDCGFTLKETIKRCNRLGVDPLDISAILVTHEHSDHSQGVGPVARKFELPVYMTPGTRISRDFGRLPDFIAIEGYQPFSIGDLDITPVPVPHDAKEPSQFVFDSLHHRLGVLTDLGSITPHVIASFARCHGLLLEFNHDLGMLEAGPYPLSLKRRVASDWGHLNNRQAAELMASILSPRLQHLIVGHISQKNNSVDLAAKAVDECLYSMGAKGDIHVKYACQNEGFDWIQLA